MSERDRGPEDFVPRQGARCELDTRADTICAGINFRILTKTGQLCDVSGFHSDFDSIKDVPVATVATAYQTATGEVFVLS